MKKFVSLVLLSLAVTACGDDSSSDDTTDADDTDSDAIAPDATIDAPVDAPTVGCDPGTVLPTAYRLVAEVSTGTITLTDNAGVKSGRIDATAGGLANAPDNPMIYVNLKTGTKVDVNDIQARTDSTWDIALKRSSLRTNGGDSGAGGRTLTTVTGDDLGEVTAVPASTFVDDDFADGNCEPVTLEGGEPMSAFGQWYDYDEATHAVSPKSEVYVIKRPDGTHSAFRFTTYYGNPASPMSGANYIIELKQL
jgi:hypothetical protein